MSWFRVTHHEVGSASIHIGNEIGLTLPTVDELIDELFGVRKVELYLDSAGGCHHTALAVYRALELRETICTITRAHSAAALIAMSGRRIRIIEGGTMMVHPGVTTHMGNAQEFRAQADKLNESDMESIQIVARRTGQTVHQVKSWFAGETYFSAEEALQNRLVDEIIPAATERSVPRGGTTSVFADDDTDCSAGDLRPAPDDKEALLFDCLTALGKIQVKDRARFAKNLQAWMNQNVS